MALVRAMSIGTDSEGGYGLPQVIDPTLHISEAAAAVNPFGGVVREVQTFSDNWRGINASGTSASWDGEAAEVSSDEPTLANTDISVHKLQVFIPASIEVTQDYPGFAAEVSKVFVDASERAVHTAIVSGSGTNQPFGIVTRPSASASEVDPTTAETFAETDVYQTAAALPARYWPNAQWFMHRGTSFDVRQFADGSTTGQHAFWTDFSGDVPSRLLGRPVNISEEMDNSNDVDAAATATNHVLLVGDWKEAYVLVRGIGFNIELVPHLFATANNLPSGQRGFFGYLRLGGDVNEPRCRSRPRRRNRGLVRGVGFP